MKLFFCSLLMCFISFNSYAADSTWLICKNIIHGNPHNELVPVLSIFEHRNGTSGRKTEITLIYGSHLLTANLKNADEGKIHLKSPLRKDDSFKGSIKINYTENSVQLRGDYITYPDSTHKYYDFDITCEAIN